MVNIMKLSSKDKIQLGTSLDTEIARTKRSINATENLAIKEILQTELHELQNLAARVSNEAAA